MKFTVILILGNFFIIGLILFKINPLFLKNNKISLFEGKKLPTTTT